MERLRKRNHVKRDGNSLRQVERDADCSANLGVSILWVVSIILFVALAMFFLGTGVVEDATNLGSPIENADPFMKVFAIVFPAFTGMTAGVGLSGDLKSGLIP